LLSHAAHSDTLSAKQNNVAGCDAQTSQVNPMAAAAYAARLIGVHRKLGMARLKR
jgi:hypothetical protein